MQLPENIATINYYLIFDPETSKLLNYYLKGATTENSAEVYGEGNGKWCLGD